MTFTNILENRYYSSMMLFFIFSYTFINIEFHHTGDIFLGLIIAGSLPIFVVHKNTIFKNPIIIIFALILITQILSWINSLIYMPDFANKAPELDRLGKLFVFFFIAYWLKGDLKNVIFLWLFLIFGFIFTIIMNVDVINLIELGFNQSRVDLLTKDSQFDSMLAGISLLISLSLFYITIEFSKKFKILLLLGIFILILLLTYLVVITQSRQVWLALVLVAVVGSIFNIITTKNKNLKSLIITNFTLMAVLFLFSTSTIIQKRIFSEEDTAYSVIKKNEVIKMDSIGVRVNSWLDAIEWIKRHPILGLDSEAIPQVIQQSTRFDDNLKQQFGHLHNFFIETLVAYGFLGLLLIFALYYFIIKDIKNSSLSDDNKKLFSLIGISFLTFWFVINNFESFNSRWLGVFVHNIIFSSIYTFYISGYLKKNNN